MIFCPWIQKEGCRTVIIPKLKSWPSLSPSCKLYEQEAGFKMLSFETGFPIAGRFLKPQTAEMNLKEKNAQHKVIN
jgi:hypothetical protein